MRRLARWTLNALTAMSLLLCVATLYLMATHWSRTTDTMSVDAGTGILRHLHLSNYHGRVSVQWTLSIFYVPREQTGIPLRDDTRIADSIHADLQVHEYWLQRREQAIAEAKNYHGTAWTRPYYVDDYQPPGGPPLTVRRSRIVAGFARSSFEWAWPNGSSLFRAIGFPLWPLALVTSVPPLLAVWRTAAALRVRRNTRHRAHAGLCPGCGYDMRATPAKCPECGRAAAADAPAAGAV